MSLWGGRTCCPSLGERLPRLFPEHSNYFGVDEKLGPVAVSLRREKLEDHREHGPQYQYRIIFRTSEVGGWLRAPRIGASIVAPAGGGGGLWPWPSLASWDV